MALLHLTMSNFGLHLEGTVHACAAAGIIAAAEAVPSGAPVAILIHGFMFDPSPEGVAAGRDPHRRLFGMSAPKERTTGENWPRALGFAAQRSAGGLCIGYGWPAYGPHVSTLLTRGRNSLAEAYRRAGEAGATLGELIAALHFLRPDLRFDLFAHSLGVRVALSAMAAPGIDRVILLGAAEYAAEAEAMAGKAPSASVYNFISRQNDPFDLAFELFTKPPSGERTGVLGRSGLGGRSNWIDLQLDNPRLERWLARRGLPLSPARARVCHWSFYRRGGVMALYRTLLRDRADWSISAMRRAAAPEGLAPRWSRLAPRRIGLRNLGGPRTT